MKVLTLAKTTIVAHGNRIEIIKSHSHNRMGRHQPFESPPEPVILDRAEAHELADFIRREIEP